MIYNKRYKKKPINNKLLGCAYSSDMGVSRSSVAQISNSLNIKRNE